MESASTIIKLLKLQPLPHEGGYYREVYRSSEVISVASLKRYEGTRTLCTSILYLLTVNEFSKLHRVRSDEIFYFHLGDPVKMIQIDEQGLVQEIIMGHEISKGMKLQTAVPANYWQATKLLAGGNWALLSCSVSPGFEFADFELGERDLLCHNFPKLQNLILEHT